MPTPITINTAAIQYGSGTTECHCVITGATVTGLTTISRVVVLNQTTLAEDWTDAELCEAVANALGVETDKVSVADAPAPVVEAEVEPEPESE